MDLLFAIEKAGKTNFQELVPVMGDLATGASATGISVNELGAALAVVTQTAGSTAQAATQVEARHDGAVQAHRGHDECH